ncbi:MAG: hypothetical protein AB1716_23700 [Planctomycetota bacterium]
MDWRSAIERIDPAAAQAFVRAARKVIDALLIEGERVRQTQTPAPRDYPNAGLSRETPGGGWISHEELRSAAQDMAEAIAAEKWTDGLLCALKALVAVGALL